MLAVSPEVLAKFTEAPNAARTIEMQAKEWFVVMTNPQKEAFVEERLKGLDPYLPRFKNARGKVVPLFPRYVFTIAAIAEWGAICSTVGVRGLIMAGDHPALVPAKEIAKIRAKEKGGLVQLPPPPRFAPGTRLTILRGSLKHREVIHSSMISRDRERVLIEMLGQYVSIIVPSADLAADFKPPPRNRLRFPRETFSRRRAECFA
jgi:transcription antitermination factor NusG